MIDREELLAALKQVEPAIAKKDLIEEYTMVWFDGKHLTASNDDGLGIRVPFKSQLVGGVPGSVLIGLLSHSKVKEVDLYRQEEGDKGDESARLKTGKASAAFSVLPMDRMMAGLPNLKDAQTFPLSKAFVEAVAKVQPYIGNPNSTMPEQTGLTVILSGKNIQMLATDGDTIAWATCPYKEAWVITKKGGAKKAEDGTRFTLPAPFVKQMLEAAEIGELEMSVTKDTVFVRNDNILVYAQLVTVEEPTDIMKEVRKITMKAKYVSIPGRMKLALARAFVMLNAQKEQYVTFKVENNVLKMSTSTNLGNLSDKMQLEGEMEDVETRLDPKLIQRGLKNCDRVWFGKRSTVLAGDGFTYMIASFE